VPSDTQQQYGNLRSKVNNSTKDNSQGKRKIPPSKNVDRAYMYTAALKNLPDRRDLTLMVKRI
jgi:hypothetical protein